MKASYHVYAVSFRPIWIILYSIYYDCRLKWCKCSFHVSVRFKGWLGMKEWGHFNLFGTAPIPFWITCIPSLRTVIPNDECGMEEMVSDMKCMEWVNIGETLSLSFSIFFYLLLSQSLIRCCFCQLARTKTNWLSSKKVASGIAFSYVIVMPACNLFLWFIRISIAKN